MKRKEFYFLLILGLSGLLSGCAELNTQFDCPMKPGVMCKSVSEVNTMIERGQLGKPTTSIVQSSTNTFSEDSIYQKTNAITFLDHPVRSGETIMRIWMAPYEDAQGNYYQGTVFYTVVKPGQWLGSPVKAVKADV